MYLKRLELKGFKSFADKTSISLEPGISVIVGPNGSGKSNICDAILWVLGERNAKSLRGSIMEDVIFAGSVDRKPVSFAEVSLVLDNSDEVLPIEYSEVSITRRLYRSGESEYLINNTSARRLDVLDILHDSGLGSDTNSIISQGNLDSVLQSKPTDRRELIEEAAGVLKHKQRKIRSQHKIDKMDQNLTRIYDILNEVERQIKPLRIRAKRAKAYDGLCQELSDLTMKIAVDDLKKVKSKWDENNQKKQNLQKETETAFKEYKEADDKLKEIRNKVFSQSSDIFEQANKQRRLSSCHEKLNGLVLLLNEKIKGYENSLKEISGAQKNLDKDPVLVELKNKINQAKVELENQKEKVEKLSSESMQKQEDLSKLVDKLEACSSEHEKAVGVNEKIQNELDSMQSILESSQDDIYKAQTNTRQIKDKIDSLKSQKEETSKAVDAYKEKAKEKAKEKEKVKSKVEDLKNKIDKKTTKLHELSSFRDDLYEDLVDIKSEIASLEKITETINDNKSNAQKWVKKNISDLSGNISELVDVLDVEDEYVNIVDAVLGSYCDSYSVEKTASLNELFNKIKLSEDADGTVRFIANDEANAYNEIINEAKNVADKFGGVLLIDKINSKVQIDSPVLANVVVVDTYETALKAHLAHSNLCFSSKDGFVVFPDSRALIFNYTNKDKTSPNSLLSYKKDLKKLNKKLNSARKKYESTTNDIEDTKNKLQEIKNDHEELSSKYISIDAEHEAYNLNLTNSQNRLQEIENSLKENENQLDILKSAYKANSDEIEKLKQDISSKSNEIKENAEKIKILNNNLKDARTDKDAAQDNFNKSVIESTSAKERLVSCQSILDNYTSQLENSLKQDEKANAKIASNKRNLKNTKNLLSTIKEIYELANNDMDAIDKNAAKVTKLSSELNQLSESATNTSNQKRNQYDKLNKELSELNVEMGKLEVRVQNALDAIEQQGSLSVDEALELPDLEDRDQVEKRSMQLRKRIANIGTINHDAIKDYEKIMERFNYLNAQVEDLQSARSALEEITQIIDYRLKDDFIDTFAVVNENFQDIFSVLFPGGTAKLELIEDVESDSMGVEVKAQPKGKRISKMSLMSGGEKSLVALCLLFAVYKTRSTPFYILDEVEAALDDSNLQRLINYLQELCLSTQLIMISHQRRTMEMADVLYGVSMRSNGVTKVVSQKLDKDGNVSNK